MKAYDIVSKALLLLAENARPGITTKELNDMGEALIVSLGGECYNKDYHPAWAPTPFPTAFCICINDEIAHGIPSDRVLKLGDVVNFDVGVKYQGLCGDAALTVIVGGDTTDSGTQRLLVNAKRTLYAGIQKVRAGVTVGEISDAMRLCATNAGYVTNIRMAGHAIGEEMHLPPQIAAVRDKTHADTVLTEGMMICLEPMLTRRDDFGEYTSDGWTLKTRDGRNSAMFEHQLLVTKEGCEILTTHLLPGAITPDTDLKTITL